MRRLMLAAIVTTIAILGLLAYIFMPNSDRLNPPDVITVMIPNGAYNQTSGLGFEPKLARAVLSSDRVEWYNKDAVVHTVSSDDSFSNILTGSFESGPIDPGESYSYVFYNAGTYRYHCAIHPWLKGEVQMISFG